MLGGIAGIARGNPCNSLTTPTEPDWSAIPVSETGWFFSHGLRTKPVKAGHLRSVVPNRATGEA